MCQKKLPFPSEFPLLLNFSCGSSAAELRTHFSAAGFPPIVVRQNRHCLKPVTVWQTWMQPKVLSEFEGPPNKQTEASVSWAEFQSHFKHPFILFSITSNLQSLTCRWWFVSEQQEPRAAVFTQCPVRPVGSLFVTVAVCTAERKYSWLGHQAETHTCTGVRAHENAPSRSRCVVTTDVLHICAHATS